MSRQSKTPAQRAQEALDVAERLLTRLDKKAKQLRGDLEVLDREVAAQRARRDHLKQQPDLVIGVPDGDATARRPRTTSSSTSTGGTTR